MRILALNWRCTRHPQAGGAEVNLFEQARRWAQAGHDVTIACGDPGRRFAPQRDEVEHGVRVRRRGGRLTVYLRAALLLLRSGRSYDCVLDVANGVPFFAPLFTRTPVVLLVHHVHRDQWSVELGWPLSWVGRFLEERVVPVLYRGRPVVAVSPTTRSALIDIGFAGEQIRVIYNGVSAPRPRAASPSTGRIVYVGRLKRYKRMDRLVRAVAELRDEIPAAHVEIAGDGDARMELEALVAQLDLDESVHLRGFVSEDEKAELLSSATVFATPSMQEGWGLSVIEANAYACPAVAYDVPGLSVAVRHGETGLLASSDDEFRDDIALLLQDAATRERYSRAAQRWAERFSWDECATAVLETLEEARGRSTTGERAGNHRRLSELKLATGFAVTSALNYAFALAMAWLLLPEDFGSLAFAQSVILLCALVLQAGFPWALARALAAGHGIEGRSMLVRGTILGNLGFAGVLVLGLAVLYASGVLESGLDTPAVMVVIMLSLPFISIAASTRGAVQGMGLFGTLAILQTAEVVAKVGFGVGLVLLGFGVAGAVAGFVAGAALSAALGLFTLARRGVALMGRLRRPSLGIAAPMLATALALTLLLSWDLLMLKLVQPDRALVGYYQGAVVLANLPYYLTVASLIPVLFVKLAPVKELRAAAAGLADAVRLTLVVVVPMALILVVVPGMALTTVFPESYSIAADALRILALGNLLLALTAVIAAAFQAVGLAAVAARRLLALVLVEPFVLALAVPRWGATGAASVFVLASGVALVSLLGAYRARVRSENDAARAQVLPHQLVRWLTGFAGALGLGAAAAMITWAVSRSLLGAVLGGLIVYVASLAPLHLFVPRAPSHPSRC